MEIISAHDREIIRGIAGIWAEQAASDGMTRLKKQWLDHNMRRGARPMVTLETWTFAGDVIPQLQKCRGEEARNIEKSLWNTLINVLYFKDDTVLEPYFPLGYGASFTPFGIKVEIDKTDGLGHHFREKITDLEKDFHLFQGHEISANKKGTDDRAAFLNGLFGDILPVKITGGGRVASLTQNLVHIMSMETMFMSMYDYPDLFKQIMDKLSDGYIELFRFMEKEKLLRPTTGGERVAQGTYAFTTELPRKDNPVTRETWGYMDSQETVNVSPEMYGEFIFPYYLKVAKEFGLLSYGCCEPVNPYWKDISRFPNLRKVSISPWCDEDIMGERLAGSDIIYHRKPSPNFLGVGKTLEEDSFRRHIKKTVRAAKNCALEFTQRDVYTVNSDISKCARYIEIVREEIDCEAGFKK